MKTKTTTTTRATFPELIARFNVIATNPDSDPTEYERTLSDIAAVIVYSVVKKCIDPQRNNWTDSGYNPTMVKIRRDVTADVKNITDYNTAISELSYHTEYNRSGDPIRVCDTPDAERAVTDIAYGVAVNDGYDLINECVCTILTEVSKQAKREPEKTIDIERPYKVHRLKRKVYIQRADSIGGYETVTTTPIQEVFKAVRRCIEKSRAIQTDPKNGYSYVEDLTTSPDGDTDTVYYRLPKYADIGGYVTDFNGAQTSYTVDNQTVDNVNNLTERLNLTKRQATILQLRLKGYGYKAIATYLGVSADNVKSQIKELRRKAKRIELTPEKYDYTPEKETDPTPTPEKTPTAKRPTKKTPTEKIIISPVNIPVTPVHKDPAPVRIYAKRLYKPDGTFTFKHILHK